MRLAMFLCLIALTTVACSDEEPELETYRTIELLSEQLNEWVSRSDDSDFGIQLVCTKELLNMEQWSLEDFANLGFDTGYILYTDVAGPFECFMNYADWNAIPDGPTFHFPRLQPLPIPTP